MADVTDKKTRSATQIMRERQAEDGRKAMAEYQARMAFVRANTERLRALRLAQEAAQASAKRAEPAPVAKAAGKRKSKPRVA